ncbi:hypothetical protein [Macrococcoides canis]|uniref:hypothetical protein n=1 Tax=Macrococcoides canis TaxID=1855823 RepID=UPI00165EA56A|nr:hypothetical protein [Macrococcus canis]QNR08424.1 hypothetical protein GL258_09155 [Macrococcus canis]
MGTKGRVITILFIALSIIGLIAISETMKSDKPNFTVYAVDTPEEVKGKTFNSMEDAMDAFQNAFAEKVGLDEYESTYKFNKQFEKNNEIPVLMSFKVKDKRNGEEQLNIMPFYINIHNGKYTASSYSVTGTTERLKPSSKYVVFSQSVNEINYDFVATKDLKYMPESDAVFHLIDEKFYIGIKAFDKDYLD